MLEPTARHPERTPPELPHPVGMLTDSELNRAIAFATGARLEELSREREERRQLRASQRGYDPVLCPRYPSDAT